MAYNKISYKLFTSCVFILPLSYSFSQTPRPIPSVYGPDVKVNYVRTWEAVVPITNPSDLHTATPVEQARMTTQYLDGLGRPLQSVIKGGSLVTGSAPTDIVAPIEYDAFGRETFKYLPYASSENNGLFKTNPFGQQQAFYSSPTSPIAGQGETFYYSKTEYEASPLSRVEKQISAGNSWVGTNRGVANQYWINTALDSVRIWNVADNATGFGSYTSTATYPAGELYKTITIDEGGKQVMEFKDKEGLIILKKVQLTASADPGTGSGHTGWLCTYYLYDDLNQLRAVIQPKGVELLSTANWQLSASLLAEQCFRYEYDERGRMVIKKVPGAGEVHLVYDARDRLVLSQDGNLRALNQWQVTLYDGLNRPIQAGLWSNSSDRVYHKTQAFNSQAYPFSHSSVPSTGWELLSETHYDNYDNLPAGLSASIVNSGYSSYFLSSYNTSPDYAQEVKATLATSGMITWTKTKILGTPDFITSVNLYDEKGRIVQAQSINQTGGLDIVTNQYTWSGLVLRTHIKQQKAGTNPFTINLATKNNYDPLWRVVKIEKNLNNTGWKGINELEYDALGQVKTKKLGAAALETLRYDYNIRGWVLGANRDYAKSNSTSNYFGYDLAYDQTAIKATTASQIGSFNQGLYTGNITGMVWKSKGDGEIRKYDFTYDANHRLLSADFNQYTNNSFNKTAGVDFSVKLGDGINAPTAYDANGNIQAMEQKGLKLNASPAIDQLSYSYLPGSNKLKGVTDAANDYQSKLGDFKYEAATKGSVDYGYDSNGNLTSDANKKITAITYNHLNLPQTIMVAGKGSIAYTYDAGGNKLKKVVTDNTTTTPKVTTTLYISGTVYENDTLQFIAHEEGRIRYKPATGALPASFQYDYFLKDHLANVRMVVTEESKTDGYPVASMETGQAATEEALYSNLATTRSDKPVDYPTDTYISPNDKVAKVRGDGQKIGPAVTLKVMAGDKVNIRVNSWYKLNSSTPASPINPINDLLAALSSGIGGLAGKVTATELSSSGILSPSATEFLTTQSTYTSSKPKAFINWVQLDEQFIYVSSSSGFEQVGADLEFKTHTFSNVPINKNGYLYIYVSNETPNIDVFFDNLQISHVRGPVLEESHLYPFGLAMQGISTKAASSIETKQKFVGQELDEELEVNLYQFRFRNHDPQIGRFIQVDPLASDYVHNSTYAYAENDVIRAIDVEGLEKLIVTNEFITTQNGKTSLLRTSTQEVNNPHQLGGGTLYLNSTLHESPNGKGASTYSSTNFTVYKPEEKSFFEKIGDLFDASPQFMIYGNGKGGDGIGSEPDYKRPIQVFNFAEADELFSLITAGMEVPDLKGADPSKLPELTKKAADQAVADNPESKDALQLKEQMQKERNAQAGVVHCKACNNNYKVNKDSTLSYDESKKSPRDTVNSH